jgi:hypothetical protein
MTNQPSNKEARMNAPGFESAVDLVHHADGKIIQKALTCSCIIQE